VHTTLGSTSPPSPSEAPQTQLGTATRAVEVQRNRAGAPPGRREPAVVQRAATGPSAPASKPAVERPAIELPAVEALPAPGAQPRLPEVVVRPVPVSPVAAPGDVPVQRAVDEDDAVLPSDGPVTAPLVGDATTPVAGPDLEPRAAVPTPAGPAGPSGPATAGGGGDAGVPRGPSAPTPVQRATSPATPPEPRDPAPTLRWPPPLQRQAAQQVPDARELPTTTGGAPEPTTVPAPTSTPTAQRTSTVMVGPAVQVGPVASTAPGTGKSVQRATASSVPPPPTGPAPTLLWPPPLQRHAAQPPPRVRPLATMSVGVHGPATVPTSPPGVQRAVLLPAPLPSTTTPVWHDGPAVSASPQLAVSPTAPPRSPAPAPPRPGSNLQRHVVPGAAMPPVTYATAPAPAPGRVQEWVVAPGVARTSSPAPIQRSATEARTQPRQSEVLRTMPLRQMFGDGTRKPSPPTVEQSPHFDGVEVSVQTWSADTPVQRAEEPAPVVEPPADEAASAAPSTAPTTGSPAAPAGGGTRKPTAAELDELAKRLYEPLSARLRTELWLDRERSGRSMTR